MKEKPNEMRANPLVKMIEVSEKRIVVRNCKFPKKNFSYIVGSVEYTENIFNFSFAFKRNETNQIFGHKYLKIHSGTSHRIS